MYVVGSWVVSKVKLDKTETVSVKYLVQKYQFLVHDAVFEMMKKLETMVMVGSWLNLYGFLRFQDEK